ncbi:MAG: glycine--tRNA ligase subunit beta [Thermincola sp.]|jgi:glycyl-tRNA synthetase beta chain|nr:glycine--tRNA ligase subunit beta [Thermincola sp.]MDT3704288.1 glycine--tRNA ligase subunit beta [Thermincola sp.]
MARDFVLEIGTEEIPARFMGSVISQLENLTRQWLASNRLANEGVAAYGTPRRMVVYITGLAEKQEEFTEEVKGPAKKAAFDAGGKPTKAAEGFARGQGVGVDDLIIRETPNGDYVFVVKKQIGQETAGLLPEFCTSLITGLSFPKPMRWGSKEMRFARPIRWLLSLFEEQVVPFSIEGLAADRITYGHRFLSQGPIVINRAAEYFDKLQDKYVIVNQLERKELIWNQVAALAEAEGGQVVPDDELLEEVTQLLEYPTALCGEFAEDYLRLPKEVLITPMREHQRYFPVVDSKGRLLNKFITVRNGTDAFLDTVREGNEKVLRARLADAEFFYLEDLKVPLRDNVEKLKKIVFQESLGTVYEKVERVMALSGYLAAGLGITDSTVLESIKQGAYLSKADLVTNIVYEFPELQGVMGQEYALKNGESTDVAKTIFEHYLPRFSGDILPENIPGRIVSIADKIDTIVGCFAVGIQPTGSQDPYALRRQALGVCYIALEGKLGFSVAGLLDKAYSLYAGKIKAKRSADKTREEVLEFIRLRLKNIFSDKGYGYDLVDAVLSAGYDRVSDTMLRVDALANLRNQEIFGKLLTAYNRVANLAKNATTDQVDPALFTEVVEQTLFSEFIKASEEMKIFLQEHQYRQFLQRFALLQQYIDNFFDGVMVMIDDEKVKTNRLALLRNIACLTTPAADLTKIVD